MEYVTRMLDLIGRTPLLKLNKIARGTGANLFVKLEHLNPSGSYKDRMALAMVEAAEQGLTWNGKRLAPGGVVCDASAGNTAPALAFVCAVKGYRARLCTYQTMLVGDSARLKITGAFGPEVYACPLPRPEILDQCANEKERNYACILSGKMHMYELERDNPEVVWVDQIYNPHNTAGQMAVGRELARQLDGKVDAWGCSIASGGMFLGTTLGLKEQGIQPVTFGVVPGNDTSEVAFSSWKGARFAMRDKLVRLMGLKKWQTEKSIVETMFEMGYPNEMNVVSNEDARNMANRLCREEGIYCGMSSGANVFVALKVAEKLGPGRNVVTIIVDRRDRYLGEYPNDIYVV